MEEVGGGVLICGGNDEQMMNMVVSITTHIIGSYASTILLELSDMNWCVDHFLIESLWDWDTEGSIARITTQLRYHASPVLVGDESSTSARARHASRA